MIVASLCTIPQRKGPFLAVVQRIVNEQSLPIDRLHVWLNGYASISSEFPRENRIVYHVEPSNPGPWIRYSIADDLGDNDVFVTLDDDIDYPNDYIARGKEELSKHDQRTAICFSGVLWDPLAIGLSYSGPRWQFMAEDSLTTERTLSLLKGQTAFFRGEYVHGVVRFPLDGFRRNDDMMVGYHLQQQGVRVVCAVKPKEWIKEFSVSNASHALYKRDSGTRQDTFQRMLKDLRFDPTAGSLHIMTAKTDRVLVASNLCPPRHGSEKLHEHLIRLSNGESHVTLICTARQREVCLVERYVDVPYRIHTVTVHDEGGRLNWLLPIRAWRSNKVYKQAEQALQARVKSAIEKLQPTRVEWFGDDAPFWMTPYLR